MTTRIRPGMPAPAFELTAVSSARVITPAALRGVPSLLLFHNHLTLSAVRAVQEAVRTEYQRADAPFLASVVDLGSVPRLARPMAQAAMTTGFSQARALLPPGAAPADYIVILPDWDGRVTRAFGVGDVGRHAALVFIDDQGVIRDVFQEADLGPAAVRILQEHGVGPSVVFHA